MIINNNLHMMQSQSSHVSPSPSFNSYSSETLAEIAARVIHEFHSTDHSPISDDPLFDSWPPDAAAAADNNNRSDHRDGGGDDDFEFASVSRDPHSSPVSADDIFYNGQIRPMYPIFDRSLLDGISSVSLNHQNSDETPSSIRHRRLPLRKLMVEEREIGSCSSSTTSEAEDIDLDGVAPGSYCVWDPKSSSSSWKRPCKKSSSTGSSSKRWKFRDLLPRSHSDGKVPPLVIFTTNNKKNNKVAHEASKASSGENYGGVSPEKVSQTGKVIAPAKEEEESKRKKQPLPYRQEFIGLFTNVNGLGRNLRPF